MKKERFQLFQAAIDQDLLEEAVRYRRKPVNIRFVATLAACFCAVLAGVLAWHPWSSRMGNAAVYSSSAAAPEAAVEESAPAAAKAAGEVQNSIMMDTFTARMDEEIPAEEESEAYAADADAAADEGSVSAALVNPMHPCELSDLSQMGYEFTLPEGAETSWSGTIETEDSQIAQIMFLYEDKEYTLRAAHGDEEDISGVYDSAAAASSWQSEDLSVILRKGAEGTLLLWYSPAEQTQWSLFGPQAEPDDVLLLAEEMVSEEGWSIFAPQDAG